MKVQMTVITDHGTYMQSTIVADSGAASSYINCIGNQIADPANQSFHMKTDNGYDIIFGSKTMSKSVVSFKTIT